MRENGWALIVGFGDGGRLLVLRNSLQTLLVGLACSGVLGLLPGRLILTQGRLAEARLTLG